jgi:hypothetical protein
MQIPAGCALLLQRSNPLQNTTRNRAGFGRPGAELREWVGEEVTDDVRYYNASLVRHLYRLWHDA